MNTKYIGLLLLCYANCLYAMQTSVVKEEVEIDVSKLEDPFVTDLPPRRKLLIAKSLHYGIADKANNILLKPDRERAHFAYEEFTGESHNPWLQYAGFLALAEMELEQEKVETAKDNLVELISRITFELNRVNNKVDPRDSVLPNGEGRKTIHLWRRSYVSSREATQELKKKEVQEHLRRIASRAHLNLGEIYDKGLLGKRDLDAALVEYKEAEKRIVDEKDEENVEDRKTRSAAAFWLAKWYEEKPDGAAVSYRYYSYVAENTEQSDAKYTFSWNKLQAITELDRTTFFARVGKNGDKSTVAKCLELQLPAQERLKNAEAYYTGQGRPQDLNRARFLFISLAKQKEDLAAQEYARFRLAECILYGLGGSEKNQKLAFGEFNGLIDARNSWVKERALVLASSMLFFGQGVEKDEKKAYEYLSRLQSDKEKTEMSAWVQVKAMMLRGLALSKGAGVALDKGKAYKMLREVMKKENFKLLSPYDQAFVHARVAYLALQEKEYGLAELYAQEAARQDKNTYAQIEGFFVYTILYIDGRLLTTVFKAKDEHGFKGEKHMLSIIEQNDNMEIKQEAEKYWDEYCRKKGVPKNIH